MESIPLPRRSIVAMMQCLWVVLCSMPLVVVDSWVVTTTPQGSLLSSLSTIRSNRQRNHPKRYKCIHGSNRSDLTRFTALPKQEEEAEEGQQRQRVHRTRQQHGMDRREWMRILQSSIKTTCAALVTTAIMPVAANARGLVQFPCEKPLLNTYHLMRGGTTLMEEENILSTNPLFLTNREAALSERGISEVQAACRKLEAANVNPSVLKYSLAAAAMDTASIVKEELRVGQNRLIPEFTFMDPRAVGKWDMMSLEATQPAVWAMDVAEAGSEGRGGRPPPNDDGTPNETLYDQMIRLRQLMSILETQFSGDSILLVFPDGTSPALLSAMIAGIPLNRVHELEFQPGEVRLDVTMARTLELWKSQQQVNNDGNGSGVVSNPNVSYETQLARGKDELLKLRSTKVEDMVSLKDQRIEADRIKIDEELQLRKLEQEEKERQEEEKRQERLSQVESRDIEVSPPVLLAGVGAYYGFFSVMSDDDDVELEKNNTTVAQKDSLLSSNEDQSTLEKTSKPKSLFDDDISSSNNNLPTLKKADRVNSSKEAYKDYMDQENESDSWLSVLGDIIDEEDKVIADKGKDWE